MYFLKYFALWNNLSQILDWGQFHIIYSRPAQVLMLDILLALLKISVLFYDINFIALAILNIMGFMSDVALIWLYCARGILKNGVHYCVSLGFFKQLCTGKSLFFLGNYLWTLQTDLMFLSTKVTIISIKIKNFSLKSLLCLLLIIG